MSRKRIIVASLGRPRNAERTSGLDERAHENRCGALRHASHGRISEGFDEVGENHRGDDALAQGACLIAWRHPLVEPAP